jgi:hypothetical protein
LRWRILVENEKGKGTLTLLDGDKTNKFTVELVELP